jgi:hypothetical protein|tara:strand:- start:833 stop:1120 length:288 start_codon:yes stop_codon:yes gene_type:complete
MTKDTEIEAAIFRRLVDHLRKETDLQNIDLMNLAGFCRNCLSKWYVEEASALGQSIDQEAARAKIYGMNYAEWKEQYQKPATQEQLDAMQDKQKK